MSININIAILYNCIAILYCNTYKLHLPLLCLEEILVKNKLHNFRIACVVSVTASDTMTFQKLWFNTNYL